jgi:hypothetical protein
LVFILHSMSAVTQLDRLKASVSVTREQSKY